MKKMRRYVSLSIIISYLFVQVIPFLPQSYRRLQPLRNLSHYSLVSPQLLDAAGLSSASATLSNPRLSYYAGVSTSYSAGATVLVITGSGNPDITTSHLFPNDRVGIGSTSVQNPNLEIASVPNSTTFVLKSGLINGVTNTDKVYATQSGTLAVNFYTGSAIPSGGSVLVEVPAVTSGSNDGLPDTAATTASNGFDLNRMSTANISCPSSFSVGTLTVGTGGNPHQITCNWGGAGSLAAGANLTVTIGSGSNPLVNPAPITTGHTQGVADTYKASIYTKSSTNGSGTTIEDVQASMAPVEGVLLSASIDETLTFTVAAITSANINSTCGLTPGGNLVTTTATSVPFGSNVTANAFYTGAQQLTVTTNAPGGYSVKIEENDQMGKDGKVCTGTSAGEAASCIKDTQCDAGTCDQTTSGEWNTNTINGLGYSLSNVSGTDASFLYNESSRTFSAKQIPDYTEGGEAKTTLMTAATVRSGVSACVLYRLSVSGTQPAGYYFNKVKYTASALF